MQAPYQHIPVFLEESLKALQICPHGTYLDVTFGRGGHSLALLEKESTANLWICDQDATALSSPAAERIPLNQRLHCNYSQIFEALSPNLANGILADLGICSAQLDDPTRGFSFLQDGPLDMRMDRRSTFTVFELLRKSNPTELADILYHFGEERRSRAIAREICDRVKRHQMKSTSDLVECITKYVPFIKGEKHPATRTFQALRIAVNHEYEHLMTFLQKAPFLLKDYGILAIISFHSLEYSWIKDTYRDKLLQMRYQQDSFEIVRTVHPLTPSAKEIHDNPRSRSARLHIYQKVPLKKT
ncbi:MAG: 16S rRNA (cytosine(1402)-N(4))-methyltransferase RsmH [Gammaproteobacteria bacterium]|nr:16S rRNA (cytosine(1402)-N(4))-methyltransferase RsmH [Gammaproteobacteria bacterium]